MLATSGLRGAATPPGGATSAALAAAERAVRQPSTSHLGTRLVAVSFGNMHASSGRFVQKLQDPIARGEPEKIVVPACELFHLAFYITAQAGNAFTGWRTGEKLYRELTADPGATLRKRVERLRWRVLVYQPVGS